MSTGHRDEDLWGYSIEKVVYLGHLAHKRVQKMEARESLRMMQTVGTAVWGTEESVDTMRRELQEMAGLARPESKRKKRSKALDYIKTAVNALAGK